MQARFNRSGIGMWAVVCVLLLVGSGCDGSSELSMEGVSRTCKEGDCAENARCIASICVCDSWHVGDPWEEGCTPYVPCDYLDCGEDATCIDDKCYCNAGVIARVDADCLDRCGIMKCGKNAYCKHSECFCEDDELLGDPYEGCYENLCEEYEDCSGHGRDCDPKTGECICDERYAGDACCICDTGYVYYPECISSEVVGLKVEPEGGILPVGASLVLDAWPVNIDGIPLPIERYYSTTIEWSSHDETVISIERDTGNLTCESVGEASVVAKYKKAYSGETIATSPEVTFSCLAAPAFEDIRIRLTDADTGEGIENASLFCNNVLAQPNGRFYTIPNAALRCAKGCDYHIIHEEYDYLSAFGLKGNDLAFSLRRTENLGRVAGVQFNISWPRWVPTYYDNKSWSMRAGFPLHGDLTDLRDTAFSCERISMPGGKFTSAMLPLPDEIALSSGIQWRYEWRDENTTEEGIFYKDGVQIVTPLDRATAWGFGSFFLLDQMLRMAFRYCVDEFSSLCVLQILNEEFDYPLLGVRVDLGLQSMDKTWSEKEPVYLNDLPETDDLVLDEQLYRDLEVIVDEPISWFEGDPACADGFFGMVAVMKPDEGLIPLGFGMNDSKLYGGMYDPNSCFSGNFQVDYVYTPERLKNYPRFIIVGAQNDASMNPHFINRLPDLREIIFFPHIAFPFPYLEPMFGLPFGNLVVKRIPGGKAVPEEMHVESFGKFPTPVELQTTPEGFEIRADAAPDATFIRLTLGIDADAYTSNWRRKRWRMYVPATESGVYGWNPQTYVDRIDFDRLKGSRKTSVATYAKDEEPMDYEAFFRFSGVRQEQGNEFLKHTAFRYDGGGECIPDCTSSFQYCETRGPAPVCKDIGCRYCTETFSCLESETCVGVGEDGFLLPFDEEGYEYGVCLNPCTRNSECSGGFVCDQGMCTLLEGKMCPPFEVDE